MEEVASALNDILAAREREPERDAGVDAGSERALIGEADNLVGIATEPPRRRRSSSTRSIWPKCWSAPSGPDAGTNSSMTSTPSAFAPPTALMASG
ncbi:MAG: hypothetical protein U0Q21_11405 [Dermatophilaceae bacterium]